MRLDQRRVSSKFTATFGFFLLASLAVFTFAANNSKGFQTRKEFFGQRLENSHFFRKAVLLQSAKPAAAAAAAAQATTSSPPALSSKHQLPDWFYYGYTWTTWGLKWMTFGVSNVALAMTSPLSFLFKAFWLGLGGAARYLVPKSWENQTEPLKYTSSSKK